VAEIFDPLSGQTKTLLAELIGVIDKTFPLPGRFAGRLPRDIAELSGLFTSRRDSRSLSYLGKPNLQSAYLRYFLPWNVFRLCRLLAGLDLPLNDNDTVLDIGAGPLTFALALWISRPDLRNRSIEFICLDRTPSILEAGKKIFEAFSKKNPDAKTTWKITTIRGRLQRNGFLLHRGGKDVFARTVTAEDKPVALVSAINFFNEVFWELSPADRSGRETLTEQSAAVLAAAGGQVLVVEPGIPRSGDVITGLRAALLEKGFEIVAPCLHHDACPFPGGALPGKGKAKWCHFAFDSGDAPETLKRLSDAAGIPKERAVLSFLLTEKNTAPESGAEKTPQKCAARIISDSFRLGSRFGRYACSARGALLVAGSAETMAALESGSAVEVKLSGQKDAKSNALLGEV
jgi:hypothetical protein